MTTKLIKRDTNWEVYQNGSLIASTFHTDFPTITFSDEVAKELGIVDVGKLAKQILPDDSDWQRRFDIAKGYNQCLSDNADKRFNKKDVEEIVKKAILLGSNIQKKSANSLKEYMDYYNKQEKEFIQSLTKEEYFCELEMETVVDKKAREEAIRNRKDGENAWVVEYIKQPKITNNSGNVLKVWK